MNLTSNFDFCVELGLAPLKAIYHLALKNESLFPHNVGPFSRTYSGQAVTVSVRIIDDDDSPADLALADAKHIEFTLPIELTVQIPGSPDPALSQITLTSSVQPIGAVSTWTGDDGQPQLGIDFTGITPADVTVPSVSGLPTLDSGAFADAVHQRYLTLPSHVFTLGDNTLVVYDASADPTLTPSNGPGNPPIAAVVETHGTQQYLHTTLPLHANVPEALGFSEYGHADFWRLITQSDSAVSVDMSAEPADPSLATTITFTGGSPAESIVAANLKPLLVSELGGFGTITEPWFTQNFAEQVIAQETASYLAVRKYPMYTPSSGDPSIVLTTPVAFLLPAAGVMAILMNRRTGTDADDFAPDDFTGGDQLALAVGIDFLKDEIHTAIEKAFPGIDSGNSDINTKHGSATLHTLTVTPSDAGQNGQTQGHLWVEGTATVHIPCWPDPDVSFSGPIFLTLQVTETDADCSAVIQPVMGHFDVGESCCDVFVDLIIPVVGWIMLAIIESTINQVGGELATDYTNAEATQINAIPPLVVGVAQLQSCLEGVSVSSTGLVMPGKLRIRRDGRSFEDLAASGNLPRE